MKIGWGEMGRDRMEEKVGVRSWTLNKSHCLAIKLENWGPGGRGHWGGHTAREVQSPGVDPGLSEYAAFPLHQTTTPFLPKLVISNCVD